MLGILAQSFNIAARTDGFDHLGGRARFDDRRDASYFPHTLRRQRK